MTEQSAVDERQQSIQFTLSCTAAGDGDAVESGTTICGMPQIFISLTTSI